MTQLGNNKNDMALFVGKDWFIIGFIIGCIIGFIIGLSLVYHWFYHWFI